MSLPPTYVSHITPFIIKKDMSMQSKILFGLWMILAIACFIGAFFTSPLIVKIFGVIFGIINLCVIMSWLIAVRVSRREYKRDKKMEG